MRPSEVLPKHREAIRELVKKAGMANPRVFGSVVRGDDKEGGDLDILVDRKTEIKPEDLGHLEKSLTAKIGIPVNVLVPGDLPPNFRDRVLAESKRI